MDKDIQLLIQQAEAGDMAAQYRLAVHYGRMIQDAGDDAQTYTYSKQAMLWLKRSAKQGYAPAVEAMSELKKENIGITSPSGAKADPASAAMKTDNAVSAAPPQQPSIPDRSMPDTAAEDNTAVPSAVPLKETAAPAAPVKEAAPAQESEKPKSSGVHPGSVALVALLIVSLLANIVLAIALWRSSSSRPADAPPSPGQDAYEDLPASASPDDAEPDETPDILPPDTDVTDAPTDAPDDAEPGSWLDLTQYSELEFIPTEVYDDYVYYNVFTEGDTLNMRSGPSTSYMAIGSIPTGTKIGTVADNAGWYLASYDDHFGWVSGTYLKPAE